MSRFAWSAAAALVAAAPVSALMVALNAPGQRALTAEMVVVGTVAELEKELVEVTPNRGAPVKIGFRVAVVKVDEPLAGADGRTHVKVGFVPPPPPPPPPPPGGPFLLQRRGNSPDLKVGDKYVFFLTRHHEGGFYVMPFTSPPIDPKGGAKEDVAEVRRALAVVADPAKALTADKADDRAFAAAALVLKYRTYPLDGRKAAEEPVPAAESRLILKGLADGNWEAFNRGSVNPVQAFQQLGLGEADGWTQPRPRPPVPGQPPANFNLVLKDAYVAWLAGPGKDYRVKRVVAAK